MRRSLYLWLALLAPGAVLKADLDRAKAEPNLEKRSQLALENAERALKESREEYNKGDSARVEALLQEVQDSVLLTQTSLQRTGKNPRRSPKYFKRAEIGTRDLLKRLDAFEREMSFADRPLLEGVKAKVQQVHDDLLMGVMEGRKK